MRTTLTIEPDVAERIETEVRRTGRSMKAVVNEALRSGLSSAQHGKQQKSFQVKARPLGLKAGFDPDRMNQLLDELQVEETTRKLEEHRHGFCSLYGTPLA